MQSHVGRTLQHRFELRALLGRAGLLYTLRGWDRAEGAPVIVKIAPSHRLKEEAARALVARHTAQPHWKATGLPTLVAVLGGGETVGWVRSYASGSSLGELLQRGGGLTWSETLQLLRPALERLAWLHERHTVHGHLVPGNLFPGGEGQIWLTDTGWSATVCDWEPQLLVKTLDPRFCAPEVLQDHTLSPAGDVYSMGLLVYAAITGHPPFGVGSYAAIVQQQVGAPLPPLASTGVEVPAAVERALERWLAKRPAARPPDGTSLLREWDSLLAHVAEAPTQALAPVSAPARPVGRPARESPPSGPPQDAAAGTVLPQAAPVSGWLIRFGLQTVLFLLITVLLTGGLLVGMGMIAYSLMTRTIPPEVIVPEVSNRSLIEAQSLLAIRGLSVRIGGEQPSSTVASGHVLAVDPPAGRRVRAGRQVTVILSTGRELVVVPSVLEFSLEAARERVERSGLHVGLEQQVWDDLVPEGRVVSQSPASGVRVEKGSEIALVVSRGRQPGDERQEEGDEATLQQALVRVIVPPSPPTQRLRILVRDEQGARVPVDRYCLAGEEVTIEVEGVGEIVVEIYLNERLVTRRYL